MTKNGKLKTKIVGALTTDSKKASQRSAVKEQKHNKTNSKTEKIRFSSKLACHLLNPAQTTSEESDEFQPITSRQRRHRRRNKQGAAWKLVRILIQPNTKHQTPNTEH